MGKVKYILFDCMMLIMTSCEMLFYTDNVGQPIRFGTTQQYYPKTRTSYSTEYDGRIEWNDGDKVSIYMDWNEGNGYAGVPREMGVYEVYGIHQNGQQSHGSIKYSSGDVLKWKGDFNGNDGRAHEFPHTFWSVYPYDTKFEGGTFEFYLPDNQSNINDVGGLGLAAYEKDINSAKEPNSEGYVELHYYPMFTTLCVTIDNEANFQIGDILKLSSNNPIAGNYTVNISERYNGVKGGDINNVSSTFNNSEIMLFIIPREYAANTLYFSLNGEQKPIPEVLHAGYKYNIKITTKEVEVQGVPNEVAQIILSYLRKIGNQGYNQFKKFFEDYFDYIEKDYKQGQNYFDEGWYKQLQDGFKQAQKDNNWSGLLSDLFAVPPAVKDGALNEILRLIAQNTTELVITEGDYKITNDFDENTNLSKYFPNLTSIKLIVQEPHTIYLTGFQYLTYVEFDGGSNGDVTLIITGNAKDIKVKKGNNHKVSVNGTQITNNNELIVPAN